MNILVPIDCAHRTTFAFFELCVIPFLPAEGMAGRFVVLCDKIQDTKDTTNTKRIAE